MIESVENWIDITEYAQKYRVSQSTLRRRIKGKSIPFRMERGKYLIKDSQGAMDAAPLFSRQRPAQNFHSSHIPSDEFNEVLHENQRLAAENKTLKSQVAELETLVKALEAELGIS